MWMATQDLPRSGAHHFPVRLNQILDQHDFGRYVDHGLILSDASPDHSTISRTRRLIDLETHEAVFTKAERVVTTDQRLKTKTENR